MHSKFRDCLNRIITKIKKYTANLITMQIERMFALLSLFASGLLTGK